MDTCASLPVPGVDVHLSFSSQLNQHLTWDPTQKHPDLYDYSDAQGRAIFVLRGGGCSQAGGATADCGGDDYLTQWSGAKSPDLNGDCIVGQDDVNAVKKAIGTNNFCADLDGNGIVDSADVAIVQALVGTHCSNITGVEASRGVGRVALRLDPNPCHGKAELLLTGVPAGRSAFRIFDVNGRLVRSIDSAGPSAEWDLRDGQGRPVASGVYAVVAGSAGARVRGTLIVLE